MPRPPLVTVMVMLRRLARSSAPARFAQPSCSRIHAGRPAGKSNSGIGTRSPSAQLVAVQHERRRHVGMIDARRQGLQGGVPVLQQLLCRRRELGLVALGRALRLGGMRHRRVGDVHGLRRRRRLPELPGLVRRLPEREHGFHLASDQQRVQPAVAVVDEGRVPSRRGLDAAVHAVQVGVDEHVAAGDPELGEQALDPPPGFADQDAAHDGLVLRGVLADHQHARRAVEPAAVKDRPPLDAELACRVDVASGYPAHRVRNGSAKYPGSNEWGMRVRASLLTSPQTRVWHRSNLARSPK